MARRRRMKSKTGVRVTVRWLLTNPTNTFSALTTKLTGKKFKKFK